MDNVFYASFQIVIPAQYQMFVHTVFQGIPLKIMELIAQIITTPTQQITLRLIKLILPTPTAPTALRPIKLIFQPILVVCKLMVTTFSSIQPHQ